MTSTKILSTKKLPVGCRQYLLNAGFTLVEADFIATSTIPFTLPDHRGLLVFTSKNAVKSFLDHPEHKKCMGDIFCTVGLQGKKMLEQAGFKVTKYTNYAEDLSAYLLASESKKVTFFSGNLRLDTLPDQLKQAGITVQEVLVYQTTITPKAIKSKTDGILFFSPSGVKSYLQANSLDEQTCFCIGTTTAAELKQLTTKIVVANKTSIENVVMQCIKFYTAAMSN